MKVTENISLREFNSFGVEARAERLVEWESPEELREIDFARNSNAKFASGLLNDSWMALGGGNNILFTRDYPGMLLKSIARGITVTAETSYKLAARAEAGVDWDEFVAWCAERGVWGAENLSGIPGTIGAAPIQNIGAYGAEVKDIISSVECFATETASTLTLAAEHCALGYRDSVFKRELRGLVIVTAVNFILHKQPHPNLHYAALADAVAKKIAERNGRTSERTGADGATVKALHGVTPEDIRNAVIDIRTGKLPDPRVTGNAGSFFKNPIVTGSFARNLASEYPDMPVYPCAGPEADARITAGEPLVKLAAGWLIDKAGWKGRSQGRVGIHPRQALVVINLGGATGAEIVDFAEKVSHDVRAKFGVELETEVNII